MRKDSQVAKEKEVTKELYDGVSPLPMQEIKSSSSTGLTTADNWSARFLALWTYSKQVFDPCLWVWSSCLLWATQLLELEANRATSTFHVYWPIFKPQTVPSTHFESVALIPLKRNWSFLHQVTNSGFRVLESFPWLSGMNLGGHGYVSSTKPNWSQHIGVICDTYKR